MTQSPHLPIPPTNGWQSPDLYALIIRLTAVHNTHLRATQGHLAHAAFLSILQQVDPAIAQAIHDQHGRKPFTVSPLEAYGRGSKGHLYIQAAPAGWLRVTLLDPILFQTFISYFLQGHRPTIQLGNRTFHVSEILSTPSSHTLAGYDSLPALFNRWAAADTTDQQHDRGAGCGMNIGRGNSSRAG